jgi:hypothetical protein
MPGSISKFGRRSEENLLQLWRGRDALNDDDIGPLRDEIERRGLSEKIESMDDDHPTRDIYGILPPGPQTYMNFSVLIWWLREIWLRYRTRNGLQVDAIIASTQRTRPRIRLASRAEMVYTYELRGQQYAGKVVRDFLYDRAKADSLVYDHHAAERIPIRISQDDPSISYFQSGLGIFDPVAVGLPALLFWIVLIMIILHIF